MGIALSSWLRLGLRAFAATMMAPAGLKSLVLFLAGAQARELSMRLDAEATRAATFCGGALLHLGLGHDHHHARQRRPASAKIVIAQRIQKASPPAEL